MILALNLYVKICPSCFNRPGYMANSPLITLTAPALDGGIGRNVLNLIEAFHNQGCRTHLLIDKPKGPYFEQLHSATRVFRLNTSHSLSGIPLMVGYLWKHKPDVILTPNVRHTILSLNARRIAHSPTKLFVNVHNTYSKTFQNLRDAKKTKRINKIKSNYPRCNGIIPVSYGVAADLCSFTGLSPEMLTPIYNPVVTSRLERLAKETPSHPWFTDGEQPIVLSVSRLEKAKNLPLLIDAFEMVRNQLYCRLAIIGEGSQFKTIESRIQSSPFRDEILLLGHRKNPYKYMKHASLLTLSSSWEGFGNVLVEAMAVGTPVVSTDCPYGPREILEDGRYGALVPTNNADALAKAMVETLRSPPPPEHLKKAINRFRGEIIAQKYLSTFGIK